MRLLVQHRSTYLYGTPALLGPHVIRLRPATHARTRIESYSLTLPQARDGDLCQIRWQQDPLGNHLARVSFRAGERVERLDVVVELTVDVHPINPFDFFIDRYAERIPFAYAPELAASLAPFMDTSDVAYAAGPAFDTLYASLPDEDAAVPWLAAVLQRVAATVGYVIREEAGVWTPEETLTRGRGSCRDSAALLVAILRKKGLAARFASGYLIQLTDEGMLPDEPRGVDRDVVDLHAWAEVFLPGAGWVGLDGTSGLFCGEGHIPLACTASPRAAAPIEGTSDVPATEVRFAMTVGRLGHEARPTAPYPEPVWEALLAAARDADARLERAGVRLTVGGEPTFNSRVHPELPEWRGEALGATKWTQGVRFARELRDALLPGGAIQARQGKHYPGESLPRWALDVIGRRDGAPIWPAFAGDAAGTPQNAEVFARALAARLGFPDTLQPAYEDPWPFLMQEARLPVDVDPLDADLNDPEERRRLARVLDRGLGSPVGWVLPLTRVAGAWLSTPWVFRRAHLFLLPGDSPVGLRLPLDALPTASWAVPGPIEDPIVMDDPRRGEGEARQPALPVRRLHAGVETIKTALCVEARDGAVTVFLPPLWTADDFLALLAALHDARVATGVDVELSGYPAPSGPALTRLSVTPDPGVLEVNVPPAASTAGYASLADTIFAAALRADLHAESYLLDGRQQGSGGGNHITLGGPTPLESPFLRRPDLLASLVTFTQHHPSLSYLFAGLFVGPTSQAPRVDEARHDSLYELELALDRAHRARAEATPPPWLSDMLFRHLLVDLAGNTHRAEICIDKLFDPASSHGRQGLVELRAFEMPPHPRMMVAQVALMRALVAAFTATPYQRPLVRHGQSLHDRYLLPYWLWRDLEDALAWLRDVAGVDLPTAAYRPFVELRCPLAGRMAAGDVVLEVRNALEPWNVLGEELTSGGTSRYVDSSMERVEVRVTGFVPERHQVAVNGLELPLRPTGEHGVFVGGVRFRAWAPPHSLHPHIGIHHPLRFDVVDRWARRSLGGCAYHVWHPEGRAFDAAPLTRFEAAARRAQRFTLEGPLAWPVEPRAVAPHPDQPYTLDLRRHPVDRPMPAPPAEEAPAGAAR